MKKAICDCCEKPATCQRGVRDFCDECVSEVDKFIDARDAAHTNIAKKWQKELESLKKKAKVDIPDGI